MAAWGYEFIFECWKYLSRVSAANEWEILSALEDKIHIPKRPCKILYVFHLKCSYSHDKSFNLEKFIDVL